MKNEELIKNCERWHDNNLHSKIIDAILEIPTSERDYDLTCILARAYNNLGKYNEAIELLERVKEDGKNDILWYHHIGTAHGGKSDDEEAVEKAIGYLEGVLLTDIFLQDEEIAFSIEEMLSDLYGKQAESVVEKPKSKKEKAPKENGKSFNTKSASGENKVTARDMAFSILDEINKEFHKPAISITLKKANSLSLTQSKVSGLPYIPLGGEIPMETENRQLSLLAQINCLELPENDLYPKEGILQFWFLDNCEMGIDWDDLTNQDNFRVIYYKEIGEHYNEDTIREMIHPYCEDDPLLGEHTEFEMRFQSFEGHLDTSSWTLDEEFSTRWNDRCEPTIRYIDDLENLDKGLSEEIWKIIDGEMPKHQIGGFPKFTQDDPRYDCEEYESFETLLFQLDSQFNNEEKEWEILLGDAGICNFFIEPERLKNCDFSRVMFTMDCH